MATLTHSKALCSVLAAGTLWSFGALIVRYMVNPQYYRWQYLFFRGITVAVILCFYLMAKKRRRFVDDFKRIGISGLVGASGLVCAFVCFIWSITLTSSANTLFLVATTPFLAAFMGILILKETIRQITWVAMTIALIGISMMVIEGLEAGNVLGIIIGFCSACGFAIFSVTLRLRKEAPQFANIALSGILCAILTACIVQTQSESLLMSSRNIFLSIIHGSLVGVGLILFSLGAEHFSAAELNLFSLVEVVGGVVWVYLPIFGINEVPSMYTIVGGCIVSGAILLNSLWGRRETIIIERAWPQ